MCAERSEPLSCAVHMCQPVAKASLGEMGSAAAPPPVAEAPWSRPPVLFLDVDGVLNTAQMLGRHALHPKLLKRLAAVVAASGCEIVLSTTWRLERANAEVLLAALELVGVARAVVVGKTPVVGVADLARCGGRNLRESLRAAEIARYLDAHPALERSRRFAVVDDVDVLSTEDARSRDRLYGRFVRTDVEAGLTEACCDRLVALLAGGGSVQPRPMAEASAEPPV